MRERGRWLAGGHCWSGEEEEGVAAESELEEGMSRLKKSSSPLVERARPKGKSCDQRRAVFA